MKARDRALYCTLFCLTFGLVTAGVWTNVVGFSANLLPENIVATPEAQSEDTLLWSRLFYGTVLFVFAPYIPRIQSTLAIVAVLCMSAATGMLILSYHQTLVDPALFSSIGVFITRGGYAFLVAMFYVLFAQRIKTSQIVLSIAVSLILETVLSILVSLYCQPLAQVFIVMVAPLVALTLYFIAERRSRGFTPDDLPKKVTGAARNTLLIQVIVFATLMALIRALSDIGSWGFDRNNYLRVTDFIILELVAIALLLLLLTVIAFILPRKRFSLPMRCLFSFVILLAGLQIIALTRDYQIVYVFDAVTNGTELFAHLAHWLIIIACIRETTTPVFRVIGLSRIAYALFSIVWFYLIEAQNFATSTLVMIIIYVLFVAVLLTVFSARIRGGRFTQDGLHNDSTEHLMRDFSLRWNLSTRESEILSLLVVGRKRSEIEAELGLSKGTIKTHISNLYRKLDVHSKSEMLELIRGFEEDNARRSA